MFARWEASWSTLNLWDQSGVVTT